MDAPDPVVSQGLESRGWHCMHMPFREVVFSAETLPDLSCYDYIVLSSKNAARLLIEQTGSQEVPPVAVVGGATSSLLGEYPLVFQEPCVSAAELVERLRKRLAGNEKILFLRGEKALDTIPSGLGDFSLTPLTVYKTRKIQKIHRIYTSGMVYFQAPSTVTDFSETYRNPPDFIGAIGPTTAKAIEELGWRIDFQPERPEIKELIGYLPEPGAFGPGDRDRATHRRIL